MSQIDEQARDEWVQAIESLVSEVERWAAARGWQAVRESQEFREEGLGAYTAPVLTIQAPRAKMVLEPAGRFAADSDGRVDLYDWPSLNRLLLKRKGTGWRLHTEAGIPWPREWSETAFEEIARLLGEAA
jgi:hypothetical protein